MQKLLLSAVILAACLIVLPYTIQYREADATPSPAEPLLVDASHIPVEVPITEFVSPLEYRKDRNLNDIELECLSKNVYFEAAVESTAGKLAVAHVTSNRVKSNKFPNTYCEVVYEGQHYASGHPKKDRCQFSWYCDGKHDVPYPGPTWQKTLELVKYYMEHKSMLKDITDGSTFYHADYINEPRWAKFVKKTVQIDTHIFYK